MFVDNDCNLETGLKIPEQLLKHLNKEDRKEVLDIHGSKLFILTELTVFRNFETVIMLHVIDFHGY